MAIELLIDREQCIGSGVCCSAVPAVFRLDEDDGYAGPWTALYLLSGS